MACNSMSLKDCCVKLERISIEDYIGLSETARGSESDDDLILPVISNKPVRISSLEPTETINKKLDEYIALSESIYKKNEELKPVWKNFEEVQLLQTSLLEKFGAADELSSKRPKISEIPSEELETPVTDLKQHIFFCSKNILQFFKTGDFSLSDCGYDQYDKDLTSFEKQLCSFKPAELQNVFSSVLRTCNSSHITNCEAFVRYVLYTICVQSNPISAYDCGNSLKILFESHPSMTTVKISSAEIFKLFFNYGVDIEDCQLLEWLPEQKKQLPKPSDQVQNYWNKIPDNWACNVKTLLNVCSALINICQSEPKDLHDLILLLLYMTLDTKLWEYDTYSQIQHFLAVCLQSFPNEDMFPSIIETVLSLKAPSKVQKWTDIHTITKMIPVHIESGVHFRGLLSFSALKGIYADFSKSDSENQDYEFNLEQFCPLMKAIFQLDSVATDIACKFLDICVSHLNIPEEQHESFCDFLLAQEKMIKEAFQAKSHLLRIYSRLQIMHERVPSFVEKTVVEVESTPSVTLGSSYEDNDIIRIQDSTPVSETGDKTAKFECVRNEDKCVQCSEQSVLKQNNNFHVNRGNTFDEFDITISDQIVNSNCSKQQKVHCDSNINSSPNHMSLETSQAVSSKPLLHDPCSSSSKCTTSETVQVSSSFASSKRKNQKENLPGTDSEVDSNDAVLSYCEKRPKLSVNNSISLSEVQVICPKTGIILDVQDDDDVNFLFIVTKKKKKVYEEIIVE